MEDYTWKGCWKVKSFVTGSHSIDELWSTNMFLYHMVHGRVKLRCFLSLPKDHVTELHEASELILNSSEY